MQLLHNMAFNLYIIIKAKIIEVYNMIHNNWYINYTQAASIYDILILYL